MLSTGTPSACNCWASRASLFAFSSITFWIWIALSRSRIDSESLSSLVSITVKILVSPTLRISWILDGDSSGTSDNCEMCTNPWMSCALATIAP